MSIPFDRLAAEVERLYETIQHALPPDKQMPSVRHFGKAHHLEMVRQMQVAVRGRRLR